MPPPQGVITMKGIYGERNNRRILMLSIKNGRMKVRDKLLAARFNKTEQPLDTTINDSLHEQLEQRYENVYYYVELKKLKATGPLVASKSGERPSEPVLGSTPRMFLSRGMFGQVLTQDRIEYTIDLLNDDRLADITTIIRKGTVTEKFRADTSENDELPPYRITVRNDANKRKGTQKLTYYAKTEVYNSIKKGETKYFGVSFGERTEPTIDSFSPNPHGNI